jgi:hypothetical protein
MHELDALEQRGRGAKRHFIGRAQVEVIVFAALNRSAHEGP